MTVTSWNSVPKRLLAVGERDADFGHAERLAVVGAVEDAVFHLGAAEGLGALLAEHPADGVGDVALAAAVRADDGGHARLEFELGLVRKALESDHFQDLRYTCNSSCKLDAMRGNRQTRDAYIMYAKSCNHNMLYCFAKSPVDKDVDTL